MRCCSAAILLAALPASFTIGACDSPLPAGADASPAPRRDLSSAPDLAARPDLAVIAAGICDNQLLDGDETATDCGGSCPPCPGPAGLEAPDNRIAKMPQEAEAMPQAEHRRVKCGAQDMRNFGPWWTGGRQLFCGRFDAGGVLTLEFLAPKNGSYTVDLYATRAPDYGRFRVYLDDAPAGILDTYAPDVLATGRIPLGTRALTVGVHRITFELVDKNPASTGTLFGVDCVDLISAP